MTESDVVLIGPRASGKTSVGVRLAGRMGRPFVDTDELVVRRLGTSIEEVFRTRGEGAFRITESRVIAELGNDGGRVIATGGGAVLSTANRRSLRINGFVVFLDVDAETALARLEVARGDRPALSDAPWGEEVRRLVRDRRPIYDSCSDLRVDAGRGLEATLGELERELRRRTFHFV